MRIPRQWARAAATLLGVLALLGTVGCSTTYQIRQVHKSGFLCDYSQFRKGGKDEAQLVYHHPTADIGKYRRILFDPVVIMADHAKSSAFTTMSPEQQQAMVNYVDARVREKLQPDYAFVTAPGPEVMRLRVAITEVEGATIVLDTVSSVVPIGLAISALERLLVGAPASVGKAGVEGEILDSLSGERLAAVVDARAGRKITWRFDKFKRYRTFEDAFDEWTTRLQERLAVLRARNTPAEASR